jgi:hypothetical protein
VETNNTTHVAGTVTPKDPANASITIEIDLKSTTNNPERTYFLTVQKPSSGQPQWPFSADVPAPDDNGSYQIIATATESDSGGTPFTGPPSSPRDVTEKVPPQEPSGVSATRGGNGVTVSWQANPSESDTYYQVQRASVNGSDWSMVSSKSTGTTFQDNGVSPQSNYQYEVRAIRSDGHGGQLPPSAWSAPASTDAPPFTGLFGPGGSIAPLPQKVQANTDPVAGLVQPGPKAPNRPVTGAPTAGGYSNLPYGGQAALNEPGTPGAQDPKGRPNANLMRTALFVAGALILFAIAAALIRIRRASDNTLEPVDDEEWDEYWDDHGADVQEAAEPITVSTGRSGSDVTKAVAAQRENSERLQGVARAIAAQRRR